MPKNLSKEDSKLLSEFGERLRRIRKARGLTQDELEHKAQVHDNMVGRLERGERIANFLQIVKITNALNIQASDLIDSPPEKDSIS